MMGRILAFLLVIVAVILLLRAKKSPRSKQQAATPVENMARCAQCGIHVPQSAGVLTEHGLFYCCEEHRQLGPA